MYKKSSVLINYIFCQFSGYWPKTSETFQNILHYSELFPNYLKYHKSSQNVQKNWFYNSLYYYRMFSMFFGIFLRFLECSRNIMQLTNQSKLGELEITHRKIVQETLLNFWAKLRHIDKLEII